MSLETVDSLGMGLLNFFRDIVGCPRMRRFHTQFCAIRWFGSEILGKRCHCKVRGAGSRAPHVLQTSPDNLLFALLRRRPLRRRAGLLPGLTGRASSCNRRLRVIKNLSSCLTRGPLTFCHCQVIRMSEACDGMMKSHTSLVEFA